MSENTCRTCKYWDTCSISGDGRRKCLIEVGRGSRGIVQDYESAIGYSMDWKEGHLVTGPNYGCIHHKPKPSEPLQQ